MIKLIKRPTFCFWCQKMYKPTNDKQRYCSQDCREQQQAHEEDYAEVRYNAGYQYAAGYQD